jgi:hypothetical protein
MRLFWRGYNLPFCESMWVLNFHLNKYPAFLNVLHNISKVMYRCYIFKKICKVVRRLSADEYTQRHVSKVDNVLFISNAGLTQKFEAL